MVRLILDRYPLPKDIYADAVCRLVEEDKREIAWQMIERLARMDGEGNPPLSRRRAG
jgi:hypothetical protein